MTYPNDGTSRVPPTWLLSSDDELRAARACYLSTEPNAERDRFSSARQFGQLGAVGGTGLGRFCAREVFAELV